MQHNALVRLASAVVLAGFLLCMDSRAASPAVVVPSIATLLDQAEQASNTDHGRFQGLLKQLHQRDEQLTSAQRWHLRQLDAWELSFGGDYAKAAPIFQDIIDHSGDKSLSALAMSTLIKDKFRDHQYVEAYALANTLMAELPEVTDPRSRVAALGTIIQMLNSSAVGQNDLALSYARQMKASIPSPAGQCSARVYETQSLLYAGKLTSDSPEFQKAFDACATANRPLVADGLRLDQAGFMVDEGHAKRAITYLRRMTPEIQRTRYPGYIASLSVTLALAYQSMGDTANARKFALASLATPGASGVQWIGQTANDVLYKVEKREGHGTAALAYYEKYVALDKAAMDDAKTRALAYQMVKQQVLAKKLKLDALDKQNRILELSQALASQAQETSRLFIALLLVVIAFIVAVLLWLRRSQLRFRRIARHDGLTGSLNREHYFEEAERTLRRLHKAGVDACLVMLDLDHFKQVNDTYGHAAGDEVLRRAVSVCRRELRESDVFGRLGGEEFGILMPACSREQGIAIATRIRQTLAATSMVLNSDTTIMVSASFGLACSAISGHALSALYGDADAALYRAKEGGRNQLVVGGGVGAPATFLTAPEVAGRV